MLNNYLFCDVILSAGFHSEILFLELCPEGDGVDRSRDLV